MRDLWDDAPGLLVAYLLLVASLAVCYFNVPEWVSPSLLVGGLLALIWEA